MLKIKPMIAIANEIQNTVWTHKVWQVRSSKVPDSSCVPKKIASAQLIKAQRREIVVFSAMTENSSYWLIFSFRPYCSKY